MNHKQSGSRRCLNSLKNNFADEKMDTSEESPIYRQDIESNYEAVGVLQTNGSANKSLVFKGPRGGLFYINSRCNQSYLTSFQKQYNLEYLIQ